MKQIKITAITSTRADYGLLRPLLRELASTKEIQLGLLVTGTHLSSSHGFTKSEIVKDGFPIVAEIPIFSDDDSAFSTVLASSKATSGIGKYLSEHTPDLVIVLGDRFEILGAVQAAFLLRIPILHLYGGELTTGALDDSIRHAITKLSHIHCVSAEEYGNRVLQLGEKFENVHIVGTLALDTYEDALNAPFDLIIEKVNFNLEEGQFVLCTIHPETASEDPISVVYPILNALKEIPDLKVLFTLSNADEGGLHINKEIIRFVNANPDRAIAVDSLGSKLYLKALSSAAFVLGNSSSGIVEAPSLGVATVNVGDRQKSRLRSPSIIDSAKDVKSIIKSIEKALSNEHQHICLEKNSPFGTPGASKRIVESILATDLSQLTLKEFKDYEVN